MSTANQTPDPRRTHWEWWRTLHGDVLHYLPVVAEDAGFYRRVADHAGKAEAVAMCNLQAHYWPPGLVSRTSARRCRRCCARLAIPQGVGTPLNEFGPGGGK